MKASHGRRARQIRVGRYLVVADIVRIPDEMYRRRPLLARISLLFAWVIVPVSILEVTFAVVGYRGWWAVADGWALLLLGGYCLVAGGWGYWQLRKLDRQEVGE